MNDLIPFTYEDTPIRVLTVNEAPWWVAADVAVPLALSNIRSSLALLDDDEKGVHTVDTPSGAQRMAIISEAGLYSLILRSRKPGAKTFKRWVTHEVLPAIRKTGSYSTTPPLSEDEIVHQALQITARRVEQLEAELEVARPKAHTWDAICSGRGDYTITEAAKVLTSAGIHTGPRKLHAQLQQMGWMHRNQRGKWAANQDRLNAGLLAEKARHYIDEDGVSTLATPQVRVTPKGLKKLRELLAAGQAQEALA